MLVDDLEEALPCLIPFVESHFEFTDGQKTFRFGCDLTVNDGEEVRKGGLCSRLGSAEVIC